MHIEGLRGSESNIRMGDSPAIEDAFDFGSKLPTRRLVTKIVLSSIPLASILLGVLALALSTTN